MLSAADSDVVRRDAALVGLPQLLDQDAFLHLLRSKLPDAALQSVRQTYLRYKPGTSCLAGYRLSVADECLDLQALAVTPKAQAKVHNVLQQPVANRLELPGRMVVDELGIVISLFPNDRRLPALARVHDADGRFLLLSKLFPNQPRYWNGTLHTLQYKPERRYVAQLRLRQEPLAVLKFYRPTDFNPHAASPVQSGGQLRLPRKIGRSQRHGVFAFRWRSGPLLSDFDHRSSACLDACSQAAAALTEVHAQGGGKLKLLARSAEGEQLQRIAKDVARLWPPLAHRCIALVHRLTAGLRAAPACRQALHGDFHADQVIMTAKGPSLLDFDEAVLGDPARDLGNFIAHLQRKCLAGEMTPAELESVGQALLDGYHSAGGQVDLGRLALYVAIGLVRLALDPFRRREHHWPERIECLLQRAEDIVDSTSLASPPTQFFAVLADSPLAVDATVADSYAVPADRKMQFIAAALNPPVVNRKLHDQLPNLLGPLDASPLRSIHVMRYKPGRRCLIEYGFGLAPAGRVTILGKARAKGIDWQNYSLLEQLWNGGFDDNSADGVSIARPLGTLDDWHMWFQPKLPGEPASELLCQEGGVQLGRRIAVALHKLHASPVRSLRQHGVLDELQILRERLGCVIDENPQWRTRLQAILEACDSLARSLPQPRMTLIHRDFYPDQVLAAGPRLFMLDLDLACQGDPALDAGNFVGHLIEQGIRRGQSAALAKAERAFTDRFLELSPATSSAALQAYATLTLARHISLSTQLPQRRSTTTQLIMLCEHRLR